VNQPAVEERHGVDGGGTGPTGDRVFSAVGTSAAVLVLVVLVSITVGIVELALPAFGAFGAGFFVETRWEPSGGVFGALPFLYGTVVTASLAMLLSVPVAIGVAVFLSDLGPPTLRKPVGTLVELIAAVPGVVYGLWAALVLAPLLRTTIEPALQERFAWFPGFHGPPLGIGLLCASMVLAVMVLPTITQVGSEVLRAVPTELREGGLALGATRWDVVRLVVLPHARRGLLGAVLLGFGRAVGETMAVATVVGSRAEISGSLFSPGYTMSSVIANEFPSASGRLHVAALAEIGLLLLVVTLVFNLGARLLVGPKDAR
jgi:phosphate transport system permease protein